MECVPVRHAGASADYIRHLLTGTVRGRCTGFCRSSRGDVRSPIPRDYNYPHVVSQVQSHLLLDYTDHPHDTNVNDVLPFTLPVKDISKIVSADID
jgi:hypothetical protein